MAAALALGREEEEARKTRLDGQGDKNKDKGTKINSRKGRKKKLSHHKSLLNESALPLRPRQESMRGEGGNREEVRTRIQINEGRTKKINITGSFA